MEHFINRERAHETRFQHQQLIEYKILARRNRLLGLWAAELLKMPSDQVELYTKKMITSIMCTVDGMHIIAQISSDLKQSGVDISENRVRKQLNYFYKDALLQISSE